MNQFTFVLVPGGWHGGWCYRLIADLLRAQGHLVYCLTLTGLGERAHLAHPGIDLQTHIMDVVAVLDCEELQDVVLLGHSYGGCVISGVAQQRPALIRSLIYLDALVLEDGENMFDHLGPEFVAAVTEGARQHGDGYLVPLPTMEFLGIGAEHTEWMMRRLSPHPLGTGAQRLALPDPCPHISRTYIDCDTPSIPPSHLTKSRIKGAPGWTYHTLHTSHDAFITEPEKVVEILLKTASAPANGGGANASHPDS
jgi:pimeloyl-ACP methyl ester carboxylesterase